MDTGLILLKFMRRPEPSNLKKLDCSIHLSWEEYHRVRRGLIPASVTDKWFIYRMGGFLYFRRSGDGTLVYKVAFEPKGEGFGVKEAWVNNEPDQLDPLPEQQECRTLDFLIQRLLLAREAPFPVPEGVDKERAAVIERIWIGDGRTAKDLGMW